ncbi:MAG: hypothetical protein HY606_00255 [Planctomycetes bacterium]|nr:hypothetical protein [Planctomycetota bacterium]
MDTTQHEGSSPEARARRLKRLRHLADLSRKDLCDFGEINISTLIGWEVGRHGGLPLRGAEKVLAALSKKGVICSVEWLMYEVGSGPTLLTDFNKAVSDKIFGTTEPFSENKEEQKVIEELLLFKSHYKNVAELIVTDDGMEPIYKTGDYVAGVKQFKDDIATTVGLDCITQLEDGKLLLRRVRKGSKLGCCSLFCINLETSEEKPAINDIVLTSSAPVLWHRRKLLQTQKK